MIFQETFVWLGWRGEEREMDQQRTTPPLPVELWTLIFSYLPAMFRGIARSVCKEWRSAAPPDPETMKYVSCALRAANCQNCFDWARSQGAMSPFSVMLAQEQELKPIIIDNGTGVIIAGFAGDDAPKSVFPNCAGKLREKPVMVGCSKKDSYVGDEAQQNRAILALQRPMKHGIIEDWDAMEKVWEHIYKSELSINYFDEHPLLISEALRNPKYHREKMAMIFFESFECPTFYVSNPCNLALYAYGVHHFGFCLDVGEGVTQGLPCEGVYPMPGFRYNFAGGELTDYLGDLMTESGHYELNSIQDKVLVQDIKEKTCYVAESYDIAMAKSLHTSELQQSYELPDGQTLTLNSERFRCPEALFQPSLLGLELPGIHQAVYNCLMRCPIDLRRDFFGNIVLFGSTTMLPGFSDRLQMELTALAPTTIKVKTIAAPERKYSTWIGGSILGSLPCFRECWVTRQQYDEVGPALANSCL